MPPSTGQWGSVQKGVEMEAGCATVLVCICWLCCETNIHTICFRCLGCEINIHTNSVAPTTGLFLTRITSRLWVRCSPPSLWGLGSDVLQVSSSFWSAGRRHGPIYNQNMLFLWEREQEQEGWCQLRIPLKTSCLVVNITFNWPKHITYYMAKSWVYEMGVCTLPTGSMSWSHGSKNVWSPWRGDWNAWWCVIMHYILMNAVTVTANYPFIVRLYIYLYLFILTENMRFLDQRTVWLP